MLHRLRHGLRDTPQQIVLGIVLGLICVLTIEAVSHSLTWENHYTRADGTAIVSIRDGKDHLKALLKGEVIFSADDRGVEDLEPGAFFELETRDRDGRRSLHVTAAADGRPKIDYRLAGKPHDFDTSAEDWLEHNLLELYRHSGFQAKIRSARLFQEGGVPAVLEEILDIPTVSVRRAYYQHLLDRDDLDDRQLAMVLEHSSSSIGSDYQLAKLATSLDPRRLESETVRRAFGVMTSTLQSDNTLRQTLVGLIDEPLEPWLAEMLLDSAISIESDYEMRSFLVSLAEAYPSTVPLPDAFSEALGAMSSDYEQRYVASVTLERHQGQPESFRELMLAVQEISSDHEMRPLLIEVAERQPPSEELPEAYFAAVASLQSNYELRVVLVAHLDSGPLQPSTQSRLLSLARHLSSEHELGVFLMGFLETQELDGEVLETFEDLVGSLSSDHERERLEERLRQHVSAAVERAPEAL